MRHTWVTRIGIVALVGGLCLVGYGLAHAEKPIKDRFKVLHNDPTWVLDRTTGLQWQKTPGGNEPLPWATVSILCTDLGDGSRLPEVKELISLVDYSKFNPALPEGNPFPAVQSVGYWSETPNAASSDLAWRVDFDRGLVDPNGHKIGNYYNAWCVR